MGKVFQLRTKKKINNRIDKGFVFNVPSVFSSKPTDGEIKKALEQVGGKDAGTFSSWDSSKYEIM
jgi:hypothetical protein